MGDGANDTQLHRPGTYFDRNGPATFIGRLSQIICIYR